MESGPTTCISLKLDIFSNFGLSSCFHFMGRFVNALLIYLNFVGDMWILIKYLNIMLLWYDGIFKYIDSDVKST